MNQRHVLGGAALLLLMLGGTVWGQPDPQARVDRLNAQISAFEGQGNYAAAIPLQQEVVAIYRRVLGDRDANTAIELNYLGNLYLETGNYAESKRNFQLTYTILRNLHGANHATVGESLLNLGLASHQLGEFENAKKFYESSLAITTAQLGGDHRNALQAINNLGDLYLEQGEYDQAREQYARVLKARQRINGDTHPDTAETVFNIGYLEHREGNYSEARSRYDQALAVMLREFGEGHAATLQVLHNSATLYDDQGDYAAAREGYAKVLRLRRTNLGQNHIDTAETLANLGTLAHQQGDFIAARNFYEESLAIMKKVRGEEHHQTLMAMNNLGVLYQDLGDYATARSHHERTLAIRQRVLGEHADTAQSLLNVGGVHHIEKDYVTARNYYDQALTLIRKTLGDEHPETLQIQNVLAMLLHEQGDHEAALETALHAYTIRQRVLGDDHPATADSLSNLGWMHHDTGDYAAARKYYEQSLAGYIAKGGEGQIKAVQVMGNLGLLEANEENWPAAIELTTRARRVWRTSLTQLLSGMSPREQLNFLAQDHHFAHALSLGVTRQDDPTMAAASAEWLINGKGMSQESLAARALLTRDMRDPKSKELAEQLLETRRKLANLVVGRAEKGQEDARAAEIGRLTQAEQQLDRQLAQIVEPSTLVSQWIGLEEIRGSLVEGEAFINIARFKPFDLTGNGKGMDDRWQPARYAAWIILPGEQAQVRVVDLGLAEELDLVVQRARDLMTQATRQDGPIKQEGEIAAETQFRAGMQQVAERIWDPLAEHLLPDTKRLIISPDGALWLLPWIAIPLEEEKYLVEDYALRLVISGRELVAPQSETPGTAALLFANPAFDLTADQLKAAIRAIFRTFKFEEDAHRGLVSQSALGKVPPLPNTEIEADAIGPSVAQITGQEPIKYLGKYALESVVKRVKNPRIMVLSTHGYFLPDQQVEQTADASRNQGTRSASLLSTDGKPIENPLLRCGLLLAGCNNPPTGGDDGILTGMEIVGLDLRGTDLVVLSACETGIGKVQSGEGVAGLRQAFQLAGAKGVVSTLWSVPDRDSAIIMRDFFENLAKDGTRPEALRHAQCQRIESRRQRYGAAHPFFWAAWTITGN